MLENILAQSSGLKECFDSFLLFKPIVHQFPSNNTFSAWYFHQEMVETKYIYRKSEYSTADLILQFICPRTLDSHHLALIKLYTKLFSMRQGWIIMMHC